MKRLLVPLLLLSLAPLLASATPPRIIILKVDGLNADLLSQTMTEVDAATGKSKLPWLDYIFRQNGTVFRNFYTRGISLSAPSWAMLDTGRHSVIRGNVEYDRYTGEVYDYLNFFPFYIENARSREEDMPGVRVLDRAGIPLVIDRFPPDRVFQSFQLFQRLVQWPILAQALKLRFSAKALLSSVEAGDAPSLDESLAQQTERDLIGNLNRPEIRYLDFYTGDIDHEGHATNDHAALVARLKELDRVTGRIWAGIQATRSFGPTLLVMVSDHGMNNDPNVFSQAFNLPDLLNSPEGGAHHVITNRHQLSDYKLRGLNPLVHRVVTPSTASFYLKGEAGSYPTAWLDLDGNERASIHLRNSDLNELHILLLQLARQDLKPELRRAAAQCIRLVIERNRMQWQAVAAQLPPELATLQNAIERRRAQLQLATGKRAAARVEYHRAADELDEWVNEKRSYEHYVLTLNVLLHFEAPADKPNSLPIRNLIPEMALGDQNSIYQLQNYVVGPVPAGLLLDANGQIDEKTSFRRVDYFDLLSKQHVHNNPQSALNSNPIDFVIRALPDSAAKQADERAGHAYWVFANANNQLLVLTDAQNNIALRPVSHLVQSAEGAFHWDAQPWREGLPLRLFGDRALQLPPGADRPTWLSEWHSESEWFRAIHDCDYSNGVIGITEQFSPVAENVPGTSGMPPLLLEYERRRRELVQPDLQIFAADHWNFNARNFNPGGNHGSFLRISTHSVWMMAGDGIPAAQIEEPRDTLNFASTILQRIGFPPPMPERVVNLR